MNAGRRDSSLEGFDALTDTGTTGSEEQLSEARSSRVPGLVIVAHADAERVGEEAPLIELGSGRATSLSRHEPLFLPPGQPATPRPLGDSGLSRRPLTLVRGPGPGELTLRRGDCPTSVAIGGEKLAAEHVFRAAEIENGVVLVLAGRVALLLGFLPVLPAAPGPDFGLLGQAEAMTRLRREIQAAAVLDVPVLVRGETGSGKELVSRAVHDARPRRGPYVTVNLGALVPALAAAELFGAARGAYTGADRPREGLFRRADGGTLFLDEIGEAPPEVQVVLLRVLETGRVQAVGGTDEKQVDVRVIAATDADLETALQSGRFRPALLHRLSGYEIRVPPLRERRGDIARLFRHFLRQELAALGAPAAVAGEAAWPSAAVMARLVAHDWPGNVRELKNVARRLAVIQFVEGRIDPEDRLDLLLQPVALVADAAVEGTATKARETGHRAAEIGAEELLAALEQHAWQPGPAAKALGLSRPALYRLIEAHPELRTAAELDENEVRSALAQYGSPSAAARALKVSAQGLKRRLSSLKSGEPGEP